MTNRFESPLSTKPISRYIQLPFQEIHQALRSRQDEYDKMVAQQDQTKQNVLGLNSISEHDDYRDAYVQKVNSAFEELHSKNLDPSRQEYQKAQGDIIRGLASDPNLQVLKRSILNKKEYLDNVEKLKQEGKYANYNDYYKANPFTGINEDGSINEFQRLPVYSAEDHIKPVDDYFKNLKANSRKFDGITGFDKENGTITSGGQSTKEITARRVAEAAREFVPSFLRSQEGRDFSRMMIANGVTNEQELVKSAYDHINRLGRINIFKETENSNDMKVDWGTLDKNKDIFPETTNYLPQTTNPYDLGEPVKYENGKILVERDPNSKLDYNKTYMTSRGPMPSITTDGQDIPGTQKRLDLLRKEFPGKSERDISKMYNTMIDSMKSTASTYTQNISDEQKSETKRVLQEDGRLGSFANRPIVMITADGSTKPIKPQELFGFVGENYDKGQVSGKLNSRNPFGISTGDVVSSLDKNGNPVTFVIGRRSIEEEDHFSLPNQLAQSTYSLEPVERTVGNQVFKSVPKPKFDDKGNFIGTDAEIHIYTKGEDGKTNRIEKFDIERNGKKVETDHATLDEFERLWKKINPVKKKS